MSDKLFIPPPFLIPPNERRGEENEKAIYNQFAAIFIKTPSIMIIFSFRIAARWCDNSGSSPCSTMLSGKYFLMVSLSYVGT